MTEPTARIEAATTADGMLVVRLLGEVDLSNARSIEAQILDAARNGSDVVLDLSSVEYLDSAGLALVYRLSRTLEGNLRLVAAEGAVVRRTLDVAGVEAASELPA